MKISLTEQVVRRFIVSGMSGALSTVGVVTYYTGVTTWEQFQTASGALGLALVIGFINGILMALHKYFVSGATISTDSIEVPEALLE